MQIDWKTKANESPYLFRRQAVWTGVRVHHARVMPGRMLEHAAEFHEVNVALGGQLITKKISASGKLVVNKGSAGNLCITPAGQLISASWDETIDHMGILIEPHFINQTAIENCFGSSFEFAESYKSEDPLIQHIGLALLAEAESETATGRLYADSLIQSLTFHLLKNYSSSKSTIEKINGGLSGYKLRRVTEFVNENLESDLSLAEIASVADLSQFHFARAFRKSTGMTPQQYLMLQRIERAKELLSKNDLPIVEISLRTGFKNQSHFTTLFRKFTNFTPKNWRELKLA